MTGIGYHSAAPPNNILKLVRLSVVALSRELFIFVIAFMAPIALRFLLASKNLAGPEYMDFSIDHKSEAFNTAWLFATVGIVIIHVFTWNRIKPRHLYIASFILWILFGHGLQFVSEQSPDGEAEHGSAYGSSVLRAEAGGPLYLRGHPINYTEPELPNMLERVDDAVIHFRGRTPGFIASSITLAWLYLKLVAGLWLLGWALLLVPFPICSLIVILGESGIVSAALLLLTFPNETDRTDFVRNLIEDEYPLEKRLRGRWLARLWLYKQILMTAEWDVVIWQSEKLFVRVLQAMAGGSEGAR